MQDFMGKDGFSWFVGVVEDRNDPAQLGRVRVRVLGRHSDDLTQVKTTDLPWAHVMHPVTDPSMQGLGHTPTFLTQGSWVVGFFRDVDRQQPVIMGSLPGVPESPADYNKGFNDPRGEEAPQERFANDPKMGPYPGEIKHSGHSIGEPDTNRLARGKDSESHISLISRRLWHYRGDPVDKSGDIIAGAGEAFKNTLSNFAKIVKDAVEGGDVSIPPETSVDDLVAGFEFSTVLAVSADDTTSKFSKLANDTANLSASEYAAAFTEIPEDEQTRLLLKWGSVAASQEEWVELAAQFNKSPPDAGARAVQQSIDKFLSSGKVSPETAAKVKSELATRGKAAELAAINKEKSQGGKTGIPTATKPYLSNVSDQAVKETRGFWEEPHPKGIVADANPYISAAYPYNHVFESESGHITEVDDSPGAERMYRQHMAGTFEEIHPDGTVVTKIMGDNYEIVIGSENIVIKGSLNITVEGSVRELIKGDYIQEIEGDFFQKIHKNHRVKVGAANADHPRGPGGNREEEIVGNHAYNINEDVNGRIGGDVVINSEKSKWEIVAGQYTLAVGGEKMDSNPTGSGIYITSSSDYLLSVNNNLSQSTISGIMSMKSGHTLNMKSAAAMTINPETTLTQTVGTAWTSTTGTTWAHTSTGNAEINAARIDLN